MVITSEISRLNGAKSRGPQSVRGKALAAQNATKHGLLSTKPPLVPGEDLESFQGIVQGLINEYQPQTATEQLLVQQAAMGWLRLHRLWGAEAAIASLKMIRIEEQAKYPETSTIDTALALLAGTQVKQAYTPSVLRAECQVIRELGDAVFGWLWDLPKRGLKQWLVSQECQDTVAQLQQKLGEFKSKLPAESIPPQDSEQFLSCFWRKLICEIVSLEWWLRRDPKNIKSLRRIAETVVNDCDQRINEIKATISDQARLQQAEQEALIASQVITPDAEKLARYERHINHALYKALDRLELSKQQRNHAGSIGSFG